MTSQQKIRSFLLLSFAIVFSLIISEKCFAAAYAYISNSNAANVTRIRVSDTSIVDSIPVTANTYGVAVDPDGDYVYFTDPAGSSIRVLRTSDNNVSSATYSGTQPAGIAVSPDGDYLYVANGGGDISIIDLTLGLPGTEYKTPVIGTNPHGIVVTPDQDFLYVTDDIVAGQVYKIDISGPTNPLLDDTITDIGEQPRGIAIDPTGSVVIVVNSYEDSGTNGTYSFIQTSDDTVSWWDYVGSNPFGIAIEPGGTYAYITMTGEATDNVAVINYLSLSLVETITVGNDPKGVAITPDGSFVYVVNNGGDTVSIIDTSDYDATPTTVGTGDQPIGFGNFIGGKAPTPLPADFNLTATLVGDTVIEITWNTIPDATYYKLIRKRYVNGLYVQIATIDQPDPLTADITYTDSSPGYYSYYYYVVVASNFVGDSDLSNEDYAITVKQKDGDGGGCFIATAAFGSPIKTHVVILCKFRDRFMLSNPVGKSFVTLYYKYSPPIANYIADHSLLRLVIRGCLLPVIGTAWLFLTLGPMLAMLSLVTFFTIVAALTVLLMKQRRIRHHAVIQSS